MNENTRFIYENAIGRLEFGYSSEFGISEITGAGGLSVDISESRGVRQIGSNITNQSIPPRTLVIDGYMYEPLKENRAKLLKIISPSYPATLTMIDGNDSWYLDVVPQETPDPSPGNGVQFFQAILYAAYPYWRSTDIYAEQVAGLDALFRFPFCTGGTWYISKYSEDLYKNFPNSGNAPISLKITFAARSALSNPELYHMDTGKKILLNKQMVAGDKIIVSTAYGERGVVFVPREGIAENGFRYLVFGSDLSMELLPGDNMLRADAGSNRQGLSVRIQATRGVKSGV